jgi:hypothetical protein
VYFCWGGSKYISITQNKHTISLVLALIWKDHNKNRILGSVNNSGLFNHNINVKSLIKEKTNIHFLNERKETTFCNISPLERSKAERKGPRTPEAQFGWKKEIKSRPEGLLFFNLLFIEFTLLE